MTTSRRHFIKTAGVAAGALSLLACPCGSAMKEFHFSFQSEAI